MRFEIPDAKELTLEMVIPMRWGDMDAMGTSTTRSTSATSRSFIERLHRVEGAPDPAAEGPVIVNTFCNFLTQLKYPAD